MQLLNVGFEHMWGPATVPGLGNQASTGLASHQPTASATARLPDDFPALDFPDWDGPGKFLSPASANTRVPLHDM